MAADPPKKLDQKRLTHIVSVMESGFAKFEWSILAQDGEEMLPYIDHILRNPDGLGESTRTGQMIDRSMLYAIKNLTKYDCARLVDPVVNYLRHDEWEVRASAMMLLEKIGGREECAAVAVLLHGDFRRNRIGAGEVLKTLGGRRELFALDHWLSVRAADATAERSADEKVPGYEDASAKLTFECVKKCRDALRDRLEVEAKKKPVEPTEADKVVAKFADTDAKVRAGAVAELKKVGTKADSTAVVALLHDPDAKVREAAAEWLGAVGGKRELVALEIRIREHRAADDPAFDAFAKAKKAVAARVDADEKKDADPKAKPPEKK